VDAKELYAVERAQAPSTRGSESDACHPPRLLHWRGLLETVAKALQGWEGARDDLGFRQLRNYQDNPPADLKPQG
jgi:hypothetical protein